MPKIMSTKEYVQINSVRQGLIIETVDSSLPVLLIVHGGPGFPVFPIMKANKVSLHTLFTVCYWDQRGTGMSYVPNQNNLTIEQMVSDTISISHYLCEKFDKEKIYLLGHSWGTLIGSLATSSKPALFEAYIGVGQVGVPKESEKETYQFLLEEARRSGNQKWIAEIEGFEFDSQYYNSKKYNTIRSKYTEKFRVGFIREGYSNLQILKDIFRAPHYTFKEKTNVFKGIFSSYQALGKAIASTDLIKQTKHFDIPVYLFHGKHDYLTSQNQAFQFYNTIKAPDKAFFLFEHSAHAPFIDEQENFIGKLREIVKNKKLPRPIYSLK